MAHDIKMDVLVAVKAKAKPADVNFTLNGDTSDWYWLRLPNGDLVLATYPTGDTYENLVQVRKIEI